MIYFNTKKNKQTVEAFLLLVEEFWNVERKIEVRKPHNSDLERYQELRESIARKIPSIINISSSLGVSAILNSYPPVAIGGPVIQVNIYESILQDDSHGHITEQRKRDTLNNLIGELEIKIDFEYWKVINPFFWLGLLLTKVLRIPFWLMSKTGFEISKLEDHFLGKIFKLIEIAVLLYLSLRLGIPDDWGTTLLGSVGK